MSSGKLARRGKRGATFWIGALKILQSGLLLVIGVGAVRLLDGYTGLKITEGLARLNIDPSGPLIQRLIDRVRNADPHQLKVLSVGSFIYAGLLLIEGTGLCLQKRWGEYFTVLVTGSFIPFELYECFHGFSMPKAIVLLLNAAVLAYLVIRLRSGADQRG